MGISPKPVVLVGVGRGGRCPGAIRPDIVADEDFWRASAETFTLSRYLSGAFWEDFDVAGVRVSFRCESPPSLTVGAEREIGTRSLHSPFWPIGLITDRLFWCQVVSSATMEPIEAESVSADGGRH